MSATGDTLPRGGGVPVHHLQGYHEDWPVLVMCQAGRHRPVDEVMPATGGAGGVRAHDQGRRIDGARQMRQ